MVHFSPLEGDPNFPGKDVVLRRAEEDLATLTDGGVDAVLFENNFDNPKFERLPPQQADHFSELVSLLSSTISLPWGISALWNDYELGFRLCKTYGGTMVRVPVFVDSVETIYGTFLANPKRVLEARSQIQAEHVRIFADVQVKHAKMIHPRPLKKSVKEAVSSGADTIVITGTWTGNPPTVEMVREAQAHAKNTPIYIGSGMTADNIASFLPHINGCIVGTAFKQASSKQSGGPNIVNSEVRYNTQRIQDFVKTVRQQSPG